MSVMQTLYDAGINVSVSSFWDGGFDVRFGDKMNGFKEGFNSRDWLECERWLMKTACRLYPKFAEAYPGYDDDCLRRVIG